MNSQCYEHEKVRLEKYKKLKDALGLAYSALEKFTKDWPHGPHGQGPYTGNTRESRQIKSMTIQFTPTRGGSEAVEDSITDMHIEAWEVGRALAGMIKKRIETIEAEMEKI